MTERRAHLSREHSDEHQTLGVITTMNGDKLWSAHTLELKWEANINNVSCIPTGIYLCKYTRSNRLSASAGHDVFTYEVMNVPHRAGIRFHSANFARQLLGCIALGNSVLDIDGDGVMDIAGSRDAIRKFEEIMNRNDFTLIID